MADILCSTALKLLCVFSCVQPFNSQGLQLMLADYYEVFILNLDDNTTDVVINKTHGVYSNPNKIDYHKKKNVIVWLDNSNANIYITLYPSTQDDNGSEVVVSTYFHSVVFDIAVDSTSGYLYWSYYHHFVHDSNNTGIMRCNLDGSNRTTVIGYLEVYGIAIDTENGIIYYGNKNNKSIDKCTTDGRFISSIVFSVSAYAIVIDSKEERLYSIINGEYIMSTTFDGRDSKILHNTFKNGLFSLDLSGDYLYFTYYSKIFKLKKNDNSVDEIYSHPYNHYLLDVIVYQPNDECFQYTKLENAEKRSSGFIYETDTNVLNNDVRMEQKWYRIVSNNGDNMPTFPPGIKHCGTRNPIWLSGHLPSVDDGNITGEACVQTTDSICSESITIEIRNCGRYYLYYLQDTPENSAFCFGSGPVACPEGMSSETGFYPGCGSSFPNDTATVFVVANLTEGKVFNIPRYEDYPSLLPVFQCQIDNTFDPTYVYDVYWYINEHYITSFKNIIYDNMETTDLKPTDWMETYKMNMEVKCAIRMRFSTGSIPSPYIDSTKFQAGLFPEKYEYTVIEGESVNITFTSTVPVGCISSHPGFRSKQCSQNFYIFHPNQASPTCSNSMTQRNLVFKAQFCGIKLGSLDWEEKKDLQVYGFSDGLYNYRGRSSYIRVSTISISTTNEIWKNIEIPDIKVTVLDKDSLMNNRMCQSYNDPHITTFDGKYYHYMEVGEFVMYRNSKGPYWVHTLLTNCGFGWQGSACHCGIAVRSRRSLFVLRTCEKISRIEKFLLDEPITELITCDENDLLVVHNSNSYTITLPIGTEIKFSISRWSKFISGISIKPSIYDINEAKGLCGYPSITKDPSDDYMHRTNGPISDDQTFGDSWRITNEMAGEQLFVLEPAFLTENIVINIDSTVKDNTTRYCVCEDQAGSTELFDDYHSVHCNLTESTEYCSRSSDPTDNVINAFYTSCVRSTREKRSIGSNRRSTNDEDDVVDFKPLSYDDSVNLTESLVPQTFRNGWTEQMAYEVCRDNITRTLPSDLYSDFVDISVDNFIEACVQDIKLVGDTLFLHDTVCAMTTNIITEMMRNESLYFINTTDDSSETILEHITSRLCPNNCSENGNCTLGICFCNTGYSGEDCSKDKSIPPSDSRLPASGLCGLKSRSCSRTNVYGDFSSTTVWYKLRHFEITDKDIRYASNETIHLADYRNMFMISVDLTHSKKKRTIPNNSTTEGYEISLSNDGVNFGENLNIVIYDDECYTCNSKSLSCVDLGVCLSSSIIPESSNDENQTLVIVAACVGGMLAIDFVAFAIICLKPKKRNPKKKVDVFNDNGCSSEKQLSSSQTWSNENKSVTNLDLHFTDSRQGTSLELFEFNDDHCKPTLGPAKAEPFRGHHWNFT